MDWRNFFLQGLEENTCSSTAPRL